MKKSIFLTTVLCIFALAMTGCANSDIANHLNNKYAQEPPTEIIPDKVQELLSTADTLNDEITIEKAIDEITQKHTRL